MTLRQLALFLAVAEELHFGRAARRTNISQPGLTHQIAALERELGCALFERSSRRVELTPPGEALVERARALLSDAEEARHAVERTAGGEVGVVRVGFVGTALYSVLPPLLRASRSLHPDLELTLIEAKTAEQLQHLRAGRLDVGIVHTPAAGEQGLEWRQAHREPVGIALPDDHRLGDRKRIGLEELAADPLVLFPRELEPDTHDAYLRACANAGFVPEIAQRAGNLHTILGLVASGLGFAFVAGSVSASLQRRGVVFCELRGGPTLSTSIAWPEAQLSPAGERFRSLAVEIA